MHVLINGTLLDYNSIDVGRIKKWLEDMPDRISMTRISPVIVEHDSDSLKGIVLLAESHVSIHINNNGNCFVDVFSCKSISIDIIKFEVNTLGISILNCITLNRGLEYLL